MRVASAENVTQEMLTFYRMKFLQHSGGVKKVTVPTTTLIRIITIVTYTPALSRFQTMRLISYGAAT